jgi:hypothetical protein
MTPSQTKKAVHQEQPFALDILLFVQASVYQQVDQQDDAIGNDIGRSAELAECEDNVCADHHQRNDP